MGPEVQDIIDDKERKVLGLNREADVSAARVFSRCWI
jgi:hypothetical protein